MTARRSPCILLPLLALPSCFSLGPDPAAATPQRPTVSSDTNTTKHGTLELEAGITVDPRDSFDSPITLKWGADTRTELFAGWSPLVTVAQPGPDAEGIGDSTWGVRHRFLDETGGAPAAAVQLMTKLPTGDRGQGLSTGEIDFFVAAILNKAFGQVGVTMFYQAGAISDPAKADTGVEHTIALAAGLPVSDEMGVFGELAGILRPEDDQETWLLTLGATWSVSPSTVFDVACMIGLDHNAPDLRVLAGFTNNFGRLFGERGTNASRSR